MMWTEEMHRVAAMNDAAAARRGLMEARSQGDARFERVWSGILDRVLDRINMINDAFNETRG